MAYTAKDLYVNGLARFGMNFPDGLVGETNSRGVYSALNAGLAEFYVTHDWDFLLTNTTLTTAAGTQTYALPSGFGTLASAGILSLNLELKVLQDRKRFMYGTVQGVPRFYTVDNDTLSLYPTPSGVNSILVRYYKTIDPPNATSQGATALYTYLDTITYATLLPAWVRPLAELYVAKNAALLLKDREAYKMISDAIAATRSTLDDNVRRSTAPVPPQTRQDW